MFDMNLVLENFKKHGIEASLFETAQEAVDYLAQQIQNKAVAFGGSVTLKEIGLYDALERQRCAVVWQWKFPNTRPTYDLAKQAEVYVTSANGVSATGEIVNIDGTGNRVAATAFGPKEVYYVVGKNKLEEDLPKALWRAKHIASPKNAQRLNKKTPCAIAGDKCYDCNSPDRICRVTSIIDRKPGGFSKMEILFVNEDLGF
jgi:L-lactate utilization protein LutB